MKGLGVCLSREEMTLRYMTQREQWVTQVSFIFQLLIALLNTMDFSISMASREPNASLV